MKKLQTSIGKNESGLVSITLTIFIIIILTLTLLAFSQISRRETRNSLDRQISTQALYAAESGVNTAVNMFRKGSLTNRSTDECASATTIPKQIGPRDSGTSTSCILYDAAPQTLQYTNINKQNGKMIPLVTQSGSANSITFEWNAVEPVPKIYTACPDASNTAVPQPIPAAGCDAGYLRATIITTGAGLTADQLYQSSYTVFLKPSKGGSGVQTATYAAHGDGDAGNVNQGQIIAAACDSGRCKARIDNIPNTGETFLHLRSLYKENTVSITNNTADSGFTRAQLMVDSTGKVGDVLRRVQVRVAYLDDYEMPSYAIETVAGICKKIGYYPPISGMPENDGSKDKYLVSKDCGGGDSYFQ